MHFLWLKGSPEPSRLRNDGEALVRDVIFKLSMELF